MRASSSFHQAACRAAGHLLQRFSQGFRRYRPWHRKHEMIDALEPRLLLASDDDIVIHRITGLLGVSTNGFFVPFGPGNQTINAGDGNDSISVEECDNRVITINMGTGTDSVFIAHGDLDKLEGGTIVVNNGDDSNTDQVFIDDVDDAGNDEYDFSEPTAGLTNLTKPADAFGAVRVGQLRIHEVVACSRQNNTINLDSTLSLNNTDQLLQIDVGESSTDTNTVNFDGSVSSLGRLRVNGQGGDDTLNLTGDVFTSSGTIEFFAAGGNNLLNIDDTAATDTYTIAADSITMVDGAQTGTIDYNSADITLTSESTTAASSFVIQTPPNPIANGSDITINCGGGDDVINVGTGRLAPLFGSFTLNGDSGADSIAFNDSSEPANGVTYTLSGNHFDTSLMSPASLSSFSSFLLEAGSGTSNITVGTGNGFFSSVQVVGNGGSDNFDLTPSVGYEITALGGNPTVAGDDLDLIGGGASRGELNLTGTGQGDYTFSNRNPVHFAGMESFTQPAAALGAPDLAAADDKGRSSTDNITNLTTLTFGPSGGTSVFSVLVLLYRDGVENATTTAPATGSWSIDGTFPTGDATYAMTARFVDPTTGLLSTPSAALNVRVDTLVPSTPGIPNLATVSDSGQFNNDNITNLTTPTFTGTVEGSAIVSLRNSTTQIGSNTAPAGGTVSYSVSPSPALSEGIKSINVTQQDVAGNTSSPSSALSVTIDTTPPGVSSAPDLQAASDHGRLNNDNVTNVNTPTFTVSGPELIRLSEGATILADYATPPNVTSPVLSDGSHDISARSVDVAGNTSAQTVPLTVTIDTAVPAQPAAPDMTDATDSGKLNNDNITKFTQPSFSGTIEANARVSLRVDGSSVGTITPAGTTYLAAPISALSNGNRSITITQEDVAGNVSIESPALVVTIDTIAPTLTATPVFNYQTGHSILYSFSELMTQTFTTATAAVQDLGTLAFVPNANKGVTFLNTDVSLAFNPVLADGNYRATITTALTDTAGNAFAGNTLDFYVLAGDANRDRKVNFQDLVILAQNYNTTGKTFGQGNFNYDAGGVVNFADLVLFAQRYNTELAPPPPPPAPPVQSLGKPALATVPAGIFSDTQIVRAKPVAAKPVAKPRRR
jgi:hypothetical protein